MPTPRVARSVSSRSSAEPLHDSALDHESDHTHDQWSRQHAEPEVARPPLHEYQGVHASHEEIGVGQIDHPQQAEDDGQAEGDQDQDAGQAQAIENLGENGFDHEIVQSACGVTFSIVSSSLNDLSGWMVAM